MTPPPLWSHSISSPPEQGRDAAPDINTIYTAHMQHLIDSRADLRRYRTYAITANMIILAIAVQGRFAGIVVDFESNRDRDIFVVILCAVAFVLNASMHYLTYLYYHIIDASEHDLAALSAGSRSTLWRDKIQYRHALIRRSPVRFHFGYFGFFWLFYFVAAGVAGITVVLAGWIW